MPGNAAIIDRLSSEVNGRCARAQEIFRARTALRLVQFARQLLRTRERGAGSPRLVAAVVLACAAFARSGRTAEAPRWAVAVMPLGEEFSLEIAADDAARQKGYMFREKIGSREGMLFLFDASERHPFWMKNCRVPLDIIWLDPAFRIVDIAHDLPPCPEDGDCPPVQPKEPARYALEIAGGAAKRLRLKLSDPIVVLSDPPLR